MTYAFVFDASSCTGCKACQVACKDKNNLPAGVLWRRVYEVAGGGWMQQGQAWTNSVFASSLSMACNHCVHPKCAGVCPTDAYAVRPDGIVSIDTAKCVGCGYCSWACPYDAPQVDKTAGTVTKCDLCRDYIDSGLPPACVASCPLRCLDLVQIDDENVESSGIALWKIPGAEHPFPLPTISRTEPHLIIYEHPSGKHAEDLAQVSNREEVSPTQSQSAGREEIPLLIFTLLTQMAIGAFGVIFTIAALLRDPQAAREMLFIPSMSVGILLSIAILTSFFHLGTPKNAWRVLNHLRKSWLSREILFLLVFSGLWVILAAMSIFRIDSPPLWTGLSVCALFSSLFLLFCMQRIYQLRSVPGWNTFRTLLEFTGTALTLGPLLTGLLIPAGTPAPVHAGIALCALVGLAVGGYAVASTADQKTRRLSAARAFLLLACLIGVIPLAVPPFSPGGVGMLLVFILALAEEAIGRWLFYARRKPGI